MGILIKKNINLELKSLFLVLVLLSNFLPSGYSNLCIDPDNLSAHLKSLQKSDVAYQPEFYIDLPSDVTPTPTSEERFEEKEEVVENDGNKSLNFIENSNTRHNFYYVSSSLIIKCQEVSLNLRSGVTLYILNHCWKLHLG
jgi:hypothetical protein